MSEIQDKYSKRTLTVELLDARGANEKKGILGSFDDFFKSAVGAAVLSLLFTTVIGGIVGYEISEMQRKNAETAELHKAEMAARADKLAVSRSSRKELIDSAARTLTSRRLYAGILRSAIDQGAPLSDVTARWADYQRAYLDFNFELFTFRTSALSYLGPGIYEVFRPALDERISSSFKRIDDCLTLAYFKYIRGARQAAQAVLSGCAPRKLATTTEPNPVQNGDAEKPGLATELTLLNKCIFSFEIELASTIDIENRYDMLEDDQRAQLTGELKPWSYLKDLKKFPNAKDRAVEARRVCGVSKPNQVCWKSFNKFELPAKIDKACSALDSKRYQ